MGRRADGTNPRALGTNPRATGLARPVNPDAPESARRERGRNLARQHVCLRCGAAIGAPCIGKAGAARVTVHAERVRRSL